MMPMKGLLKGLRYISQIFDNEKEEEIQIGFPTDVKHVAHIGMDGPSANTPSWMNKYNANTETSSESSNGESKHKSTTKSSAQEEPEPPNISEIPKSSSAPLESPTQRSSSKTKHSRRNHSSSSSVGSPGRDSSDLNKPRRQKNSGDISSPRGESSSRGRRPQNLNTGSDSLSENPPKVPKSRRKKSKGSSGSLRSSRSKDPDPLTENFPYSDPGPEPGFTKNKARSNSNYEEGNECDEISRGFRAL